MQARDSATTIRILIVDDHAVVRRGLVGLIASEPGMKVVGEAVDGLEAVEKTRTLLPDIVLLDLKMPRMDGLEAIAEIKSRDPEARILVLTSFDEDDQVFPALKTGALGYLLKDSTPQELLQGIRRVYEGESSLDPAIARKLVRELREPSEPEPVQELLTEREMQVLRLVAQGLTNQEIAARLFISERTVRNYVSNILGKLHLANRVQATLYALREGWVRLEDKK